MTIALLFVDLSLWLLLAVPVLALGGVHRATAGILALLATASMMVLWFAYRSSHRSVQVPWLGWALLAVTGYTALQLVPLPLGFLEFLAPGTVALLNVSLAAVGKPSSHPISLDTAATWVEVAKLGACTLAFIVAHNRLQRRARRRILLYSVVGLAGFLVLFGLVGAVVAPGRPLVFYTPTTGQSGGLISTSFVNPNHSAAFIGMGALLAVAFTLTATGSRLRAFWGLVATVLGGGVFLTLSRGGILALGAGMLALGGLLWIVRRKEHGEWNPIYLPLLFAVIFGFAGWLALDSLRGELHRSLIEVHAGGMGKLELWPAGLKMLSQNAFVGVGRGAFLTTFPRFAEGGNFASSITYSHLENQYLQLPIELGVLVGGGIIVVSAVALVSWIRRGVLGAGSAAAAAGLILLAAHNVVDFNLELLGIALPAALLAGSLSAVAATRQKHSPRGRGYLRSITLLAASLAIAAAAVVALAWGETPIAAAMRLTSFQTSNVTVEEVKRQMAIEIRRRPSDYLPHLAMARRLAEDGDSNALRWLNRGLYLNPRSPAIHLEAMRLLLMLGKRSQAFLEGRIALDASSERFPQLTAWIYDRPKVDSEVETLVRGKPLRALAAAKYLRQRGKISMALAAIRVELRGQPQDQELALAEVETLLIGAQRREEEMAQREAWAAEALRRGKALVEQITAARAYLAYAGALTLASSTDSNAPKPLEVLERGCKRFPRSRKLVLALGHAYVKENHTKGARLLADRLMKEARDRLRQADVHDLLSAIYRAEGRPHRANYEAQRAKALRQ